MIRSDKIKDYFPPVAFLISLFIVLNQEERTEFFTLLWPFSLAFISYIYLIVKRKSYSFNQLLCIAISAQVITLFNDPYLSNDYYRFIWDGELTWLGINPFDHRPNQLIEEGIITSPYHKEIYLGLSDLTKGNYSCYPTINQLYFVLGTAFSNNISVNILILKLLIIITEFVGGYYLIKALKLIGKNPDKIWYFFLNPLFIIECTGNLHFEGVMMSFLFVALYFILQKNHLKGSLFITLSIHIKLIPLLLFPFFYRYLGIKKSIQFYALTLFMVLFLGLVYIDQRNFHNFIESLQLYFHVFEFNSFALYHYLDYGKLKYGWNMTRYYAPQLSRYTIMAISIFSLYGSINSPKKLFNRILLGYFIYLLLSSTVHPWYIIPILGLSLFTNYKFPIIWSFTIFFSYVIYSFGFNSSISRWFINSEYVILLIVFFSELIGRIFFRNFMRSRMIANVD